MQWGYNMFRRFITKLTPFQHNAPQNKSMIKDLTKYVVPFLHPNRNITWRLSLSYFYLVLSKACFFGGPFMLKYGINAIQSGVGDPSLMLLGYGVCYCGSLLFQSLRNIQVAAISNQAVKELSERGFKHMLSLDPQFFFGQAHRKKQLGLTRALWAVQQNLRTFNQFFIPTFIDMAVSSALIFSLFGTTYVATFLSSFALYTVFTIRFSDYRRSRVKLQKDAQKQVDFLMSEAFANYYNVKYYHADDYQVKRYLQALSANQLYTLQNQRSLGVLNTVQRALFASGLTANLILASKSVKNGAMTAGDIIMMQSLMLQLINPLFFLGMMYRNFTDSVIDIKILYSMLNKKPTIVDPAEPVACGQLSGRIGFNNVSFRYPGHANDTLKNLQLNIQAGEFVAIVGPSGVGKSTIFKLIYRLYDPQQGQVTLDGHSLRSLKLAEFRSQIALVTQTSYLFNDSIINNILYGNSKADLSEVYRLADELGLHKLIMSLDKGYDTQVIQHGDNLFSGGQKQRLSLLRALIANKRILLLDEPTSSLDFVSEQKVAEVLRRYVGTTRVMITHREHLIKGVDKHIKLQRP